MNRYKISLIGVISISLIALASAPANARHGGPHAGGQTNPTTVDLSPVLDLLEPILDLLEPKTIFVTSTFHQGDFGGLAFADTECQTLADADGSIVPAGEYVALLSISDAEPASARITPSSGPYIRPDGAFIAANSAALFSVQLDSDVRNLINPIEIDETGTKVPLNFLVHTGTTVSGTSSGADRNCNGWTTKNSAEFVTRGQVREVDRNWIDAETDFGAANCSFMLKFYCVQR